MKRAILILVILIGIALGWAIRYRYERWGNVGAIVRVNRWTGETCVLREQPEVTAPSDSSLDPAVVAQLNKIWQKPTLVWECGR
jgi:hypothetical protein